MTGHLEVSMCILFCVHVFTAAKVNYTLEYTFKREPKLNNFLPMDKLLYYERKLSVLSCNSECVQNLKCPSVTICENSCYFYSIRNHVNITRQFGAVTSIMTTDTKLWYDGYTCKIELLWCYKYHDVNVIWTEAQDICVTEGGNLLTIDTMEKQNIIVTATKNIDSPRYFFTGINDRDQEGTFVDIHGKPIQFTFWYTDDGQPNDYGDHDCMAMATKVQPRWFDNKCNDPHSFICDILIP